jgi:hypothetical protein
MMMMMMINGAKEGKKKNICISLSMNFERGNFSRAITAISETSQPLGYSSSRRRKKF